MHFQAFLEQAQIALAPMGGVTASLAVKAFADREPPSLPLNPKKLDIFIRLLRNESCLRGGRESRYRPSEVMAAIRAVVGDQTFWLEINSPEIAKPA